MKAALVVGCGTGVWEEVEAAKRLVKFDAVYCVKLAGVHWKGGRFTWATLHPEFMDDYEKQRADLGYHWDYEIVAPLPGEVGMHGKKGNIARRVTYRYPGMNASASSGGYAAKVALDDGFEKVILAGVPMRQEDNHFTRGKPWLQRDGFINGFNLSLPHFKGRVKSLSGWTREQLGEPTKEWLAKQ